MDGVISPPITRFKWDYGGTLSTFMPPYLHILPSPCLHCVNYIYISMPGPVGWKIQVKTKGCRYCMPQYKHNLIIVTGRRYRPNIKGELLSFLHSHVCISFSHPLYLSRCVGFVLTPPPRILHLTPLKTLHFDISATIFVLQSYIYFLKKVFFI